MDRELTPEEITELLPAYALDAVDDDERAAHRRLPGRAPRRARRGRRPPGDRVDAGHAGGPPPEGVWERLESIIATSPPPTRIVPPTVLTPRARGTRPARPTVGGGGWLRPPWSSPSCSAGCGSSTGATAAGRGSTTPRLWRPPRRPRRARATSPSPTRVATRSRPQWSPPAVPATSRRSSRPPRLVARTNCGASRDRHHLTRRARS